MANVNTYRLFQFYLVIGLFVLPFVYWPWAAIPYEIPRVWFVQRWIEGLGILGCIISFKQSNNFSFINVTNTPEVIMSSPLDVAQHPDIIRR